ncbi:NADH-dependent formate dehydrogenase delta subunit [Altererythrobacter sp. B11]|uniref:formate dehydrogenase subunit delta n=1 Tax=Altererythrobacter sp. B11 TaxID=2060312 RepID=UPI000DC73D5C|nr:formate dehydrogenase subunit delta [Altererythrobacter sp. B11]BBC71825.1 NADH-dependent formate dehydrogenase delta subunit [Altererythrobacter sp. B11]
MSIAKLRRMADQIGLNFAAIGHDNAVLATADHINKFWDPRMKAQIFADDHSVLSPIARAAIEKLAAGANPPPQTRATEFNAVDELGHSDAG